MANTNSSNDQNNAPIPSTEPNKIEPTPEEARKEKARQYEEATKETKRNQTGPNG